MDAVDCAEKLVTTSETVREVAKENERTTKMRMVQNLSTCYVIIAVRADT